jgi:hypothetical protein
MSLAFSISDNHVLDRAALFGRWRDNRPFCDRRLDSHLVVYLDNNSVRKGTAGFERWQADSSAKFMVVWRVKMV